MGRIALPARTSKPCLLPPSPPRTRRDPPARPSSSTSLPTTRWTPPRPACASSSLWGRWSPPRRLWLLPPLARREQEASSCPPRSPRPRSPQPRRRRSQPRRPPPRRSRSSHSNLIVHHYSFFYLSINHHGLH